MRVHVQSTSNLKGVMKDVLLFKYYKYSIVSAFPYILMLLKNVEPLAKLVEYCEYKNNRGGNGFKPILQLLMPI